MATPCSCVWTARPSGMFGIEWVLVLMDPTCTGTHMVAP